ncbi:Crp/Fnr family transcriptional regulator [Taibaiella sp. KBW10]|uniref:Crp/Fnr family transcriptional regulator n=1 Tax=Taibaiella sp. KBW10 TaxID=2153357 RepID=UPI000F5AFD84|nr:Crp/Fnr family transcriptional regulator [Taibaiella sp. KBW10]RQO31700.1 Crp/Fnr family transcriptional regulator [Taibaiella sp. KBW10]
MIQHYLEQFNVFTTEEITEILSLFEIRKVQKHDFFIREGERCREIAFITSGLFRSYYVSDTGTETTYCFRFEQEFLAAYSSFITGKGSLENMQALSAASLYVIQKSAIDTYLSEKPNWIRFLKIIAEQQYIELEQRVFQLQKDSALKRYRALLDHQPEYIRDIPLQHLASYLGITQRHLSRIRKEIMF